MAGIDIYASLCGTELWNRERLVQYMSHGVTPNGMKLRCEGCAGLPDIIACVEDQPPVPDGYVLPELDPAPWYDPLVPESWNFAGLLVLEANIGSALDRRMVQNAEHGATLTHARFRGRTLDVRGLLIGKTCCSVDYGLRWLTQALLGNFCDGCATCDLTFLSCCPAATGENDCLVMFDEQGRAEPYFRAPAGGSLEWQRGLDFARQMCNVGLVSGPEIVSCRSMGPSCGTCGCANVTEVEFTLGLGVPWMYRLDTLVAEDVTIGDCPVDPGCVTFVKSAACQSSLVCPTKTDCSDDPDCDEIVGPPVRAIPANVCGCLPLEPHRTCVTIPADREWFEQVLIVELNSGSAPMRNVAIRAFNNPLGRDCCAGDGYFVDCEACATLFIDYIPADATLTFDSACRKVTITCNGMVRNAAKNLSTVDNAPFRWIELGCQGACVMIDVDCDHVAADATATVRAVGREL